MILPSRPYAFYAACDPGFSGAISLMNADGTLVKVWDMGVKEVGEKKYRALDLDWLKRTLTYIKQFPDVCFGLENPTTRPGEGAERCFRFGRQLGTLESFIFLYGFDLFLISPQLWTGRLGLPGKEKEGWAAARTALFATFYADRGTLIKGKRGGLLDGRLDAILIAHWLRTQGGSGIKAMVAKHGKDSIEVQAFILGGGSMGGRKRRGMLPRI